VAYPYPAGLSSNGAEKYLRRGTVGILFQKVMLHRPDVIEAELICQPTLLQRIVINETFRFRRKRPGRGQLKENAEFDACLSLL